MGRKDYLKPAVTAAVMLMLAGCASSPARAPQATVSSATCNLLEMAELPVEISPDGDAFVPVRLNGKNVEMALSTEAVPTFLFEDDARKLGLDIVDESVMRRWGHSYGGYEEVPPDEGRAHLKSFDIDAIQLQHFDMLVLRNANNSKGFRYSYRYVMGHVAGVIGSYLISYFDVEFDLKNRKIRLFSPVHCTGIGPYWGGTVLSSTFDYGGTAEADGVGPQIRVPVVVNGHAGTGIFASSDDAIAMDWSVAALYGISKDTPGVTKESKIIYCGTHQRAVYGYTLSTLTIGDETWKKVPIEILDLYSGGESLSIGEDFFIHNRVYISYKEKMIYFTPYSFDVTAAPATSGAAAKTP